MWAIKHQILELCPYSMEKVHNFHPENKHNETPLNAFELPRI